MWRRRADDVAAPRWPSPSGDGQSLPVADGTFEACRVERTLQHVDDPARVVDEIARILRPGARWRSVNRTGTPAGSRAAIPRSARWCRATRSPAAAATHGWGGPCTGWSPVPDWPSSTAWAASVIYDDFTAASEVFPLAAAARQAARDSLISPHQAESWSTTCARRAPTTRSRARPSKMFTLIELQTRRSDGAMPPAVASTAGRGAAWCASDHWRFVTKRNVCGMSRLGAVRCGHAAAETGSAR